MAIKLDPTESPIRRAIKTVGVGKKGSQPMDDALTAEVVTSLKKGDVSKAALGAFLAGLWMKGVEPHEASIEQALASGALTNPETLVNYIAPEASAFAKWVCVQLLNGHTLDKETSQELGRFLMSTEPGDALRGLVASLLRVRYETDDEYEGLWQAIQETIEPQFKTPTPEGEPIVQIAEPFDGNDHSYLITPLVGGFIQSLGYRALHMVGRNSGPKLVFNLYDVVNHLEGVEFLLSNADLAKPLTPYGYFLRQQDVSKALDRWVDVRHQTIKRPFLATLEKFVKPVEARIIITSAFHPPYGEKMTTISERAGYPGVIVVRNGIEGSIAFPLMRPAKLLLSAKQADGHYVRHEITIDVPQLLADQVVSAEEKRELLSAEENAKLIKTYSDLGTSHDEWFDKRVLVTCEGLKQGFAWLERTITWRG